MDPDKGFVLRTDASDYAVGAVLEQIRDDGSHVPVAFWSRILAEGQRRPWTAREKETYAIVCALRKWSGHIGLQPMVVCTDLMANCTDLAKFRGARVQAIREETLE